MVRVALPICCVLLIQGSATGLEIIVDYTYANSFFSESTTNGQQARATVEAAADYFSEILTDTLDGPQIPDTYISTSPFGPPAVTTWDWNLRFFNPATGALIETTRPDIQPNEYRIYVGARSISGTAVGRGGPAVGNISFESDGAYASDQAELQGLIDDFSSNIRLRGEPVGEFAPWGGSLAFDTGTTWNYDHNALPSSGENDLFSVAIHEMGHALGFGTSEEFESQVFAGTFTGSASIAANGDNAPRLDSLESHWRDGTQSTVYGTTTPQETAMDPIITTGTRKLWTTLDAAALADIGWSITPPVVGLAGDYNDDGRVDAADYTTWRDNLGTPDAIGTYTEWTSNYGASAAAPATSAAVPEPSSLAVIVLALVASIASQRGNVH